MKVTKEMGLDNISIFDLMCSNYKINKPVRLIELFAGVGSQAMALRNLGADFEHYKVVEFDKYAIASYNTIHNTNFETTDITKTKGEDLSIINTNKYEYIMTYSFPCQDLSVAGKMQGMAKDSGTRSGLLWEVERLLNEVEELPQILLMENVPQVIGKQNINDFQLWQKFLESKGYSNYVDVLNAKDYGVAQNRKRCFMVSILGNYSYEFPKPIPLTKTMKDYLENEVDEKYYINSEKAQKLIKQLVDGGQLKDKINCVDGSINEPKTREISNCIKARYDAGISNLKSDGGMVVEVKVIGQMDNTIDHTFESANRVYDKEGLAPTINTCGGGGLQPKVIVASKGRNPNNPSDRTPGNYVEQRLEPNSEGICNTLTSVQKDNLVLEPTVKIKQATKEGYIDCKLGGVADLSYPTSKTRRGRVQDNGDTCPTLTASEPAIYRIEQNTEPNERFFKQTIETFNNNDCKYGDTINAFNKSVDKSGISPTLTTRPEGFKTAILPITHDYRIRKLIPKECWRLMSFTDEDFYKAEQVNSNTQLYKQAGNSIVVSVLEAIFKNLF